MGDFNRKFVIREAENIIEEFYKKDREEKDLILKIQKDYKKIRKINLFLKIIVAIMFVGLVIALV